MPELPTQPETSDLVLGGRAVLSGTGSLVLGSLEGRQARLFKGTKSQQMAAALAAMNAGKTGEALLQDALHQGVFRRTGTTGFSTTATSLSQLQQELRQRFLELGDRSTWFEVVTLDQWGQPAQRQQVQTTYFQVFVASDIYLEMVAIPAGRFLMGAPESGEQGFYPQMQSRVRVDPFFISRYPVTQAQWQAVAMLTAKQRPLTPYPACFQGRDRPVESITWYDIQEFCERLTQQSGLCYRLPTEAEWEYACRAGSFTPFHFGETLSVEVANYNGNYVYRDRGSRGRFRGETTPVGHFSANAFGLHDMHGNVWEWCHDRAWFDPDDDLPRPLRGGSWASHPLECHASFHCGFELHHRSNDVGFRVVCSPP